MSSFCDYVIFSVTILGPHIDYGGYLSARHDSPDIDLIFMVYWLKFTSSFRNWVSFSITIYNIGSPYLAHKLIDDAYVLPYLDLVYLLKNISHKQFARGWWDIDGFF